MKKLLLLLPCLFITQQSLAIEPEDEENYKQEYAKQLKPLVMKKLSTDRPDMTGKALRAESEAYVVKMAGCQLEGLSHFPEAYREQAIMPVAGGAAVDVTTQALNAKIKKDIDDGKISKDAVNNMIQNAQQSVQMCLNG